MTRFDALTVLLKAVGGFFLVFGAAGLHQAYWHYELQGPVFYGHMPQFPQAMYFFGAPSMHLLGALVFIVAARPIARIFGERPEAR